MQSTDRIALCRSVLDTFLRRSRDRGHVVLEVLGRADEYVQFQMRDGCVHGEVGSRQWNEPDRPLSPQAVSGLTRMGFTGGGPERNHARDGLPSDAGELATLADSLLRTAYGLDDEYCVVVRELNLNDVAPPRAEPFTRAMIEAHLRDRDAHFLRDEDGDFLVELDREHAMWLVAEGEGEGVYRISSSATTAPASRADALERSNAWNREHRWPKAFVCDHEDGWRIVLCSDVDLGAGVSRPLFDAFTMRVVQGMVEFWEWMASEDAAAQAAAAAAEAEQARRGRGRRGGRAAA